MLLELDREQGGAAFDPAFRRDILCGLSSTPKSTPARWFYDRRGSELFEDITQLSEYYPTRTERQLLKDIGPRLASACGTGRAVVEFGAGSAAKTPLLLSQIDPAAYVPIDISGDFLHDSCKALAEQMPGLRIYPVEADFMHPVALPDDVAAMPKLGFFLGSTIGNMLPGEAVDLLRAMRESLGDSSMLMIGMDRIKDLDILIPAYDDAAGVTADFNLNLLTRINRELRGTIPVDAFAHRAIWNDEAARIEMHLEARRDIAFTVSGTRFAMQAGETIHTENSHKYGPRDARLLLRAGGWEPVEHWTDAQDWFSIFLAKAA